LYIASQLPLDMSEKNYDPRMHTAEHILNQTMVQMFGCSRSKNAHIERKKSKCDYQLTDEPSSEQMKEVESRVNEIISSNIDVTEELVNKSEADSFLDLSKLPADAPDMLRIIRVGNYDACACIGPHVKKTGEIGKFRIISTDFNNGVLRIRFKLDSET
jgi:alanyl-tRNA synthetase